jgi:universal stress protein A
MVTLTMTKTILVAHDFSPDADAALTLAIEVAQRFGQPIEIAHVHESGSYVLPPPFDLISLPPQAQEYEHLEEALAERAERVGHADVAATTQVLTGVVHEALVARAREIGSDLIVIGSRGAGALAHVLLGSVAERVVRHAPCPVLVVPHVRQAEGTATVPTVPTVTK